MKLNKFNEFFIKRKLDRYGIKNYTINSDGTVDVNGDVELFSYRDMEEIPFKFGSVSGNFYISHNRLRSLEGSPYYVGDNFKCSNNNLTNLKWSPKEVGGYFDCRCNNLSSLEGMPLEIGDNFYCTGNKNLKEINSISNIEGIVYCDNIDISKFQGYCKEIKKIKTNAT